MGFYFSKAISQMWALLKHKRIAPTLRFDKELTLALLAGIVAFVSFRSQIISEKKEMVEKEKTESQATNEGLKAVIDEEKVQIKTGDTGSGSTED